MEGSIYKGLGKLLRWLEYPVAAGLILGTLFLIAMGILRISVTISGNVISQDTKMPLEDVLVYVHSGAPYEENGLNTFARTDIQGKFRTTARGHTAVSVWKPGYALGGVIAGYSATLLRREITIEVRKLTPTAWTSEHLEFFDFRADAGFQFASGLNVKSDDPRADVVIVQDPNDKSKGYLEARGDAGIIFQPVSDNADFYNSPEAPSEGYLMHLALEPSQNGFYFLRTRDGKHYAKFRLYLSWGYPMYVSEGPLQLFVDHTRVQWAYQPDGTRNLEVAPGKDLPFPVEKFGVERQSLGQ